MLAAEVSGWPVLVLPIVVGAGGMVLGTLILQLIRFVARTQRSVELVERKLDNGLLASLIETDSYMHDIAHALAQGQYRLALQQKVIADRLGVELPPPAPIRWPPHPRVSDLIGARHTPEERAPE